jgi:DNA invertase Pin-like site-specific DNA recombinase
MVTKLDWLAGSVPDARDIVDELTARGVRLNLGCSQHDDPTDPIGRLLFTVLSMIAEFEADLARPASTKAWPSRKPKASCAAKPKLNPKREAQLVALWRAGTTPPSTSPRCSTSPAPPCNCAIQRAGTPPAERREPPGRPSLSPAT